MPIAKLEFKLPEEQCEYKVAVQGGTWKSIVYDLSMFLRNSLKHGHTYKTADEALEAVKEFLWDECREENVDPWSD
jgi:hypothetical protein